ncbi:MFS transporter [soil metagenome]
MQTSPRAAAVTQRSAQAQLTVAALGTLLTLVAFTLPIATLNSTAATLGAGTSGRTWILSSMSIGLGAALLSTGTVSDDLGRRRTFAVGVLVLGIASVLAAVSPGVLLFVGARVLQGIGGAAVIASSLGIIATTFPPGPERAAASGVWGASVGAGIAIGPLMAAGFDVLLSWRDAYWVLAADGMVLGVVALRVVTESRSEDARPIDLPGLVLLAGGMSALLAALVEGRLGWTSPTTLSLAVASVVLLVGFVAVERRSTSAMLDLGLFRHPPFVAATVAAFATGAGVISLTSYFPGFAGRALGVSALQASLLMLLWSATSVVTALLARRIPLSVPGRVQLAIGLLGVAVGQAVQYGVGTGSTWVRFVPGLFVAGVASGVLNAALGREAVASVPPGRGSVGSGANNTARYVGSAVVVTVVSVIAAGTTSADLVEGWNRAAIVTALVSVVGALVVLASRARKQR